MVDSLIVRQGTAWLVLALPLLECGKRVLVINNRNTNSASVLLQKDYPQRYSLVGLDVTKVPKITDEPPEYIQMPNL